MKRQNNLRYLYPLFTTSIVIILLVLASSSKQIRTAFAENKASPQKVVAGPIIINHTTTDITKIPSYWLGEAKKLVIHYAHTSHGGQINIGLQNLESLNSTYDVRITYAGSSPPSSLPGNAGELKIYDGNPPIGTYITPEDFWATTNGINATKGVANTSLFGFSMWSWCGQQSTNSTGYVQQYLDQMNAFETQYPNMRFIYMTGHADPSGSYLLRNNQMVRDYVTSHSKILFDFWDIDTHDPAGNSYPDTSDACDWCQSWCDAHPSDCTNLPTNCYNDAHSHGLNCRLKAGAFWWMMARLAGWNGVTQQLPGQITLISPNGTIVTNQPTYTWQKDVIATHYRLQVSGSGGSVINQIYSVADANCGTTNCSVTPTTTLANGNFNWTITGQVQSVGDGPISSAMSFTVNVQLPSAATLVSPNGTINENKPMFTWNVVSGVTWYKLYVDGPSGNVISAWYDPNNVCSGGTCSVPGTTLGEGAHTWWIRTWNPAGYGPWSTGMNFSVKTASDLVSPSGTITAKQPTYAWKSVPGMTWYKLWVDGASGNIINSWYDASTACSGVDCSATPGVSLPDGVFTWKVQTWRSSGYGAWSSTSSFTINTATTLIAPTGEINTNKPAFSWNMVNGATWYKLWVDSASGNIHNSWYDAATICSSGSCLANPGLTLADGAYSWKVISWNATTGYGTWSQLMFFTVNTKPVLQSPTGQISTRQPAYTWSAIAGVTWYKLWVDGPSGNLISAWYEASTSCSGATCSVTPDKVLVDGACSWKIQTWNSTGGYGPWTTLMNFTVKTAADLVSPSGSISTGQPTYTWNAVPGITWYKLWVDGSSGNVINTWFDASVVCAGGTCSVTPTVSLVNGAYSWKVQTWNSSGYGNWSSILSFTVAGGGAFSNVHILTPTLAKMDKFEVEFNLQTVAIYLDLPFDPNPPSGLSDVSGITVEAIFTKPTGGEITQPAFWYQPYTFTIESGEEHYVPSGAPRWLVRFTPQETGTWGLKLRATDANGTVEQGAGTFAVSGQSSNVYRRKGFVRVSQTDTRYFEYGNGEPFVGVGYNGGYKDYGEVGAWMTQYEQYKINFLRVWMSGSGINGSQWTAWATHHLGDQDYLPAVYFDTANTYNGSDVSMKLDNSNPCWFEGWRQGATSVEPNTKYVVWARVKLNGVTGPRGSGEWGFVMKTGEWLGTACDQASQGTVRTSAVKGSTGWVEVSGTFTTGSSQKWLDYLYLVRQNATGGEVYVDEVRVYKQSDSAKVNILHQGYANSHLHFAQLGSAEWDKYIEAAEAHGVYLKLVIDEKNEWIRNHIDGGGNIVSEGDNSNFYAGENTKVRWLQEAWWRYLLARWGYSPAVHSFEYVNEGDPYNEAHYAATEAMAKYFDENDPSQHMVTTSLWHSFPNKELWSNPAYSHIDYADVHAYISTGWGKYADFVGNTYAIETNPANIHSGNGSAYVEGSRQGSEQVSPRGLVLRESGEWILRYWMKAEGYSATCGYGSSGGTERLKWRIDGGVYWGGKEGIVPNEMSGRDYVCTSPAGSFGWSQYRSDQDRSGAVVPQQYRIVVPEDGQVHEIAIEIENSTGTGGKVWIDDIELVSPSGKVVPVLGLFDRTAMDEDTAWYNYAYGELLGSKLVGAGKPLVRGETGIDYEGNQDWQRDLLRDTEGVWLHNFLWGEINGGGMADLLWWASQTIDADASSGRANQYKHYLTFRNFMEGIPLNNGRYRDAEAVVSNSGLRAWGQRDDTAGKAHLWIQNKAHTWRAVVDGTTITPLNGSVTLNNMKNGQYRISWWDTNAVSNPVFLTQDVTCSNGMLVLNLPNPLISDVAVKIVLIS